MLINNVVIFTVIKHANTYWAYAGTFPARLPSSLLPQVLSFMLIRIHSSPGVEAGETMA